MASPRLYMCERCWLFEINVSREIITCGSPRCHLCVHYYCSGYPIVELLFLQRNRRNVRWYCSVCAELLVPQAQGNERLIAKMSYLEQTVLNLGPH